MPCRIKARLGPIRSRYLIQWVCILVKYSSLTLKLLLFTCVDIELIIDRAKITSHLPSIIVASEMRLAFHGYGDSTTGSGTQNECRLHCKSHLKLSLFRRRQPSHNNCKDFRYLRCAAPIALEHL